MSRPRTALPGPACSEAPIDPSVSASTTDAPPWSRPYGWVLPSTGIVATSRSGVASTTSMPIRCIRELGFIARSASTPAMRSGPGRGGSPGVVGASGVSVMVDRLPRVKLLLLDGHSLAYRAFFALPAENFSTSTGQNTNAVYGFTAMLINVLRDEAPTHVGVAFDVSRQTFRAAEYAEYKAGRSATPTEFSGQLPLLREVLDALRIRHLGVEGFEADDVIATLTRRAVEQGHEV